MKLLKASVITMGILILVGLTVVIVEVMRRYGADDGQAGGAQTARPGLSVPVERGFGDRNVPVPRGAEPLETRIDGNRIVVRLRLAGGGHALLVIDGTTGERVGLIRLDPRGD